jgi:hypothetical protein
MTPTNQFKGTYNQFLIEELQLWGVGRTGRDIPARGARATVKNEWFWPS